MSYKISLRAARINANLSQSEAAKKLNVSKDTVSNWESGKTSPNMEKLEVISRVYGIPYDMLNFLTVNTRNA